MDYVDLLECLDIDVDVAGVKKDETRLAQVDP
jgi:hypothetical protein